MPDGVTPGHITSQRGYDVDIFLQPMYPQGMYEKDFTMDDGYFKGEWGKKLLERDVQSEKCYTVPVTPRSDFFRPKNWT